MRHEVTDVDTAAALGSGDVPVLGTPRLVAWLEAATVQASAALLETGQTTVGVAIRIQHRRPTPVGGIVQDSATLSPAAEAGRLTFDVTAVDGTGQEVASGEIVRVVVNRERFLAAAENHTR